MVAILVALVLLQALNQAAVGIGEATECETAKHWGEKYKLPRWASPNHYDVQLIPNLNNSTLWGRVEIQALILSHTNKIALHAHKSIELDVENSYIKATDNRHIHDPIKVRRVRREESTDLMVLILESFLINNGNYLLVLEFTGKIRDDMTGVYQTSSSSGDVVLATNFERKYARRAFPCFDELDSVATFQLSIAKPKDESLKVLSNMEFKRETKLKLHTRTKGWRHDKVKMLTFAVTPEMPIYLLSFVMGRFEHSECQAEADRDHKVPVRFYSLPAAGRQAQGKMALEAVCKSLGKFADYFNEPYPLQKLDIVVLPKLIAPAVQSWGLVRYLEDEVLVDELMADDEAKSEAALRLLRGTAQQWIGNFVKLYEWVDEWIVVSLSSWMAQKMIPIVLPNVEPALNFPHKRRAQAMTMDGFVDAKATRNRIGSSYDKYYDRETSLIGWLNSDWMAENGFQASIRNFIHESRFVNLNDNWLLQNFHIDTIIRMSSFISDWTDQAGYPLVSVDVDETGRVELSQKRYLSNKHSDNKESYWRFPVRIIFGDSKQTSEEKVDILKAKKEIRPPQWFNATAPDAWMMVNPDSTGYYRVRYDKRTFKTLVRALEQGKMRPVQRWQLLEGVAQLCRNDQSSYEDLVEVLGAFLALPGGELDGFVLAEMAEAVSMMQRFIPGKLDKAFVVRLFEPAYKHYGLAAKGGQESAGDRLARQTALTVLIEHSHPEAVNKSLDLFHQKAKMVDLLDVHLRKPLYLAAAMFGNTLEYELLITKARSERCKVERTRLAVAWVQAGRSDRVDDFWSWASDPKTDIGDRSSILSHSLGSQAGVALMKRLLESELAKLVELSSLYRVYAAISWSRSTELVEAAKATSATANLGSDWPKYMRSMDKIQAVADEIRSRDAPLVASLSSKLASQ